MLCRYSYRCRSIKSHDLDWFLTRVSQVGDTSRIIMLESGHIVTAFKIISWSNLIDYSGPRLARDKRDHNHMIKTGQLTTYE